MKVAMRGRTLGRVTIGIGILMISVVLVHLNRTPEPVTIPSEQMSPQLFGIENAVEVSTIEAERTAIAVFTQSPALALSSTPFYAEIIYREVLRNLTEIPFPRRPCYLDPTTAAMNPTTPIAECGPFIATIVLSEEATELMNLMSMAGINGTVGIESTGLQGIDQTDLIPFVAVQSRLGFALPVDTIANSEELSSLLTSVAVLLVEHWEQIDYVSTKAEIWIEFMSDTGSRFILTTYAALLHAYQDGLRGESLVAAVGGLQDEIQR